MNAQQVEYCLNAVREHGADEAADTLEQHISDLEEAAKYAAAELRHAYRAHGDGQRIDPNLVSRAIQILEKAVSNEPQKISGPTC